MEVQGYAAYKAGGQLEKFTYTLEPPGYDEVLIEVKYCGICHSDLSMLDNDWGMTSYPFVPGHEVIGTVAEIGAGVTKVKSGDTVGLGWSSGSCMTCEQCMSGNHNLCAKSEGTVVGRYGGFADKVKAREAWTIPLPEGLDPAKAGPLYCGGITVFNPFVQLNVKPTDSVAIVGIGGLGHMAIMFAAKWGCEVTAFSTSSNKEAEVREMGAHHFVNTSEKGAVANLANQFDMILVTVNVMLPWAEYINALRPKGTLHFVGAAPEVSSGIFPLLTGQKSISASPLGSPFTTDLMLHFAKRHHINPITELYPLAEVNTAIEKLRNGKPKYRLVLEI